MGSSLDHETIKRHFDAARAALQALEQTATANGPDVPAAIVVKQLRLAMDALNAIDGLRSQDDATSPEPTRVPCSFCGKLIMPAATLCGFCWRRKAEPAVARVATNSAVVSV
jgi:hypothetical protein